MSELDDMDDMSCDEFAEVAAELALGVLTGRERAAALAHLDGCESCREQVRELTLVQDELLALLPSQEPPAGFESRVLERLGLSASGPQSSDLQSQDLSDVPGQPPSDVRVLAGQRADQPDRAGQPDRSDQPYRSDQGDRAVPTDHADPVDRADRPNRPGNRPPSQPASRRSPGRPRNSLSRRLLAAAAVAVALIGGGVGWGLRDATAPASSSAQSALSTAALVTSDHQNVGQVFVYNRSPWWTYMSVNMEGQGNATVTCQLEMADGRFQNVGTFHLADGYGAWGSSPYTAGPGAILGARLLSANGTVLATATF
jgi:anti-sigma-K factor RskA